jgi:hypothetical protein
MRQLSDQRIGFMQSAAKPGHSIRRFFLRLRKGRSHDARANIAQVEAVSTARNDAKPRVAIQKPRAVAGAYARATLTAGPQLEPEQILAPVSAGRHG